jgi:hypothetical protein
MSFNVFEELQEVDGKSPSLIGKCYEYNHSKRKDFILWYSIIANMDRAQCTIGVKHRRAPNVFAVLEMGVGPNEIVIRYNQQSMTLSLPDK